MKISTCHINENLLSDKLVLKEQTTLNEYIQRVNKKRIPIKVGRVINKWMSEINRQRDDEKKTIQLIRRNKQKIESLLLQELNWVKKGYYQNLWTAIGISAIGIPLGVAIGTAVDNTGIALAMIARSFGLYIELVMPENSTAERVQTMRAYGAKVILTPADKSIEGSIDYAREKVDGGGYVSLNQFGNDDNWKAHYKTTGPEIWNDTLGEVTHFVSAMGTTGTIMGVSTYLKEQDEDVQIVGVQPTDGSKIPGIRRWPKEYLPTIFNADKVDQIIDVSEQEARTMTNRLAQEEGIFCGMSSGGSVATAVKLAETLDEGIVVCIICDRGDRYLSSDLFEQT